MTLNANQKGKRFERDVAKMINKKFETNVRRTPMSGGMEIKGDIICIDDNSIIWKLLQFQMWYQKWMN